ncbi:unnamed protein product [Prorocentrum cordatum]|uniref:Alpha N-terminal protein methyltransferase 1 n=1 Tax=Prorocentrum cordatum TaxID=2364126 RepID=A0ABN9WVM8_9DINO|nr:unnamed protein product [Polarella glacialis]
MGVRVNLASNRDRGKRAIVIVDAPLQLEQLQKLSKNKLRLKATRFFAEGGSELQRGDALKQDQLVLCSAGEDYEAPGYGLTAEAALVLPGAGGGLPGSAEEPPPPPAIVGVGGDGAPLGGLGEFWGARPREGWYASNHGFWQEVGRRGDAEAASGVDDPDGDVQASKVFMNQLVADGIIHTRASGRGQNSGAARARRALDIGSGAGRVTKDLLLRCVDEVHLVEGSDDLIQQSRRLLGKRQCAQCHFYVFQLQNADGVPFPTDGRFDIRLGAAGVGVPHRRRRRRGAPTLPRRRLWRWYPRGRHAEGLQEVRFGSEGEPGCMFFAELAPDVGRGCCSIVPDAHHQWLFCRAGLDVASQDWDGEFVTYGLRRA